MINMYPAARRGGDGSFASAFLSACTSAPLTDEVVASVHEVTALLESALSTGDLSALKGALAYSDELGRLAADVFASAAQTLAGSLSDRSVAALESFVHRCADIERRLFADDFAAEFPDKNFAFAM